MKLVDGVQDALDDMPKKTLVGAGFPEKLETIQDLTFSGRVLLYHQDFLSLPQKADIVSVFQAKNFSVQFRGPEYLGDQLKACIMSTTRRRSTEIISSRRSHAARCPTISGFRRVGFSRFACTITSGHYRSRPI
jgi:hypothetical protein